MSNSLADHLDAKRAELERHLDAALRPQAGLPESLGEAMRYSLLAKGKRFRPLLVVLAAEACNPAADPWPAACAVEMVLTYSLIHDDLPAMDDDDLRRGRPTCHKQFGEALAILAGDALLTMAFQVLTEGYPPAAAAGCCRELARAAGATGMVGGQADDLAWEQAGNGPRTVEGLEQLHARKTGALIRASLRLGVLASHADSPSPPADHLERLDAFGRCLGLAFQITDDLLDVEGHADRAGKRVQKDAARGKLTYPGFLGVAESRLRTERLGQQALDHLAPLGPAARHLRELVATVLERDR